MIERLAAYGAVADVVPTISVEPPRTPQQMEKAVRGLVTGRYEWIGFTSTNAVRAVRERFEELGLDARAFAGLKVAAVGGVTADALRDWGINPDLVPAGSSLLQDCSRCGRSSTRCSTRSTASCCPGPDIATDTLVAGLREMGWEVDDVTAYRTVRAAPPAQHVQDAIKGGDYDAVVFTSSSTVRNLVGIAGKPHAATVVACIGPATAKTAEEHGLRVDVLAPEASAVSWSMPLPVTASVSRSRPPRRERRCSARVTSGRPRAAAPMTGEEADRDRASAPPAPDATLRALVAETRLHAEGPRAAGVRGRGR